ncbi:MAG: acyltransferase, partial [Rhizorhabdus sp.]
MGAKHNPPVRRRKCHANERPERGRRSCRDIISRPMSRLYASCPTGHAGGRGRTRQPVHHSNNIGLIRLAFASLVVIAHAYVLTGIAMQEPLAVYTETFTLGSLGVDGFFLISGYLITQSMIGSRSQGEYLLKRMLRIYPAFMIAYVIGGLVAGWIRPGYPIELWRALFLFHPVDIPASPGGEGFTANSPMRTIAYEFRCY